MFTQIHFSNGSLVALVNGCDVCEVTIIDLIRDFFSRFIKGVVDTLRDMRDDPFGDYRDLEE